MFTLSEMLKRNYKRIGCCLLALLVFAMNLTACSQTSSTSQTTTNTESASLTELHFDTIMSISLYGSDKNELVDIINEAYDELDRLEAIFSAQLETSST